MYSVGNTVSNYIIAFSFFITCMVTSNHCAAYQELTQCCESTTLFFSCFVYLFSVVLDSRCCAGSPLAATSRGYFPAVACGLLSEEASAAAGHGSRAHGLNLCGAWA